MMFRIPLLFHKKSRVAGEALHPSFELGHRFNGKSGFYEPCGEAVMADFHFYEVNPGDEICLEPDAGGYSGGYVYQAPFYSDSIDDRFIHTYCYSEEESWATFTGNIRERSWRRRPLRIRKHGWIRLAMRKADGSVLTDEDRQAAREVIALFCRKQSYCPKECFAGEIESTVRSVLSLKTPDTLVFGLMADSHFVINGGWEDTVSNIRQVNEGIPFDGMIHLGDITDGMTPATITGEYAGRVLSDLESLGCPLYVALGNHDANYFKGNPEPFAVRKQSELYLGRTEPYYTVDYAGHRFRLIVLYSFDHTQVGQENRYGFPSEEVEWVRKILGETPKDWKVLVCSHVPLLAGMHYWSKAIRNGPEMAQVMEDYIRDGGHLLAYIHGHVHADQINAESLSFPVVAVGCAKAEDDQVHKAPGSTTWTRRMGDVTQELWDVLVVDTKTGRLDFVRFGAGEDRSIAGR